MSIHILVFYIITINVISTQATYVLLEFFNE